jgi:copper(I)-binding protein
MRYLTGIILLLSTLSAWAAGDVTINGAWARPTAPGQDSGSIQFSITSKQAAKLVAISAPVAGSVEMHSMTHEGGKMKMRAVESIALPAGKEIDLGKSGNHIMLLNLKQPLKAGDSVPFTLTVQFADKRKTSVDAKAEVRTQGTSHDMHDMKGMDDMGDMHEHHH